MQAAGVELLAIGGVFEQAVQVDAADVFLLPAEVILQVRPCARAGRPGARQQHPHQDAFVCRVSFSPSPKTRDAGIKQWEKDNG